MEDWSGDRDVLYRRTSEEEWVLAEAKTWFGGANVDLGMIFRSAERRAVRRAKRAARRIGEIEVRRVDGGASKTRASREKKVNQEEKVPQELER